MSLEAMESATDAMESGAKQRLGLVRMRQASLEAGLEAMESAMDAIESGAKQTLG